MKKGWKCPECGHCYAPWVKECEHCGKDVQAPISYPLIVYPPFVVPAPYYPGPNTYDPLPWWRQVVTCGTGTVDIPYDC